MTNMCIKLNKNKNLHHPKPTLEVTASVTPNVENW